MKIGFSKQAILVHVLGIAVVAAMITDIVVHMMRSNSSGASGAVVSTKPNFDSRRLSSVFAEKTSRTATNDFTYQVVGAYISGRNSSVILKSNNGYPHVYLASQRIDDDWTVLSIDDHTVTLVNSAGNQKQLDIPPLKDQPLSVTPATGSHSTRVEFHRIGDRMILPPAPKTNDSNAKGGADINQKMNDIKMGGDMGGPDHLPPPAPSVIAQ